MTKEWNEIPEPTGVREGYPAIEPGHTLWDAQEAGWPNHLPHEAWNEVVRLAPVGGFASSAGHPAYDPGYIQNPHAAQPGAEPPKLPSFVPDKERR